MLAPFVVLLLVEYSVLYPDKDIMGCLQFDLKAFI